MGLLEALQTGQWTQDPEQNKLINQGLLSFGLNLMASKGKLANSIGQSGLAAAGDINQYKQQQFLQEMRKHQLAQIEREKKLQGREDTLAALPTKFIKPAQMGIDATGGMETAQDNQANVVPQQMDLAGLANAYMGAEGGLQQGLALQQAIRKQGPTFHSMAPGAKGVLLDEKGNVVKSIDNPKEDANKGTALAQLIAEQSMYPVGSPAWKLYEEAKTKAATHQPAASMNNYGTPLPIQLPGGGTGYMAPPTGPGRPSTVLTVPGTGQPAIKPDSEKQPTEGERTAGFLLQRLRDSQKQLLKAIQDDSMAAKPKVLPEIARHTPLIGNEPTANAMTSSARQRVESAQLDILDSALTLGTGAAYTREQLLGYRKSYFPQLGDTEEAIKDKSARLNNLIKAAETKAGRSAGDKSAPADMKTVKRTGMLNGRKVVEYTNGTREYAD